MPHYEFFCHNCKTFFAKILLLVDCEEGEVLCPHCAARTSSNAGPPFPPSRRERAPDEKFSGESGGPHGLLQAFHSSQV
jgi:hypothetical protein